MERIIAFAVILQTVEYLQIRKSYTEDGIWAWSVIRREFTALPIFIRHLLDWIYCDQGFFVLLILRLIIAAFALAYHLPLLWLSLWLSTFLIAVRWRGTFNGGSDYMSLIVLGAVFIGRAVGDTNYRWISIALGYVGLQTCLSFFIAGVVKLKKPEWRSGLALSGFLSSSHYDVPAWVQNQSKLFSNSSFLCFLSWGIILFECLFPLALLSPSICVLMIFGGLFFQLMNTYFLGLNRFFWAWAAAYPALYWCAQRFAS